MQVSVMANLMPTDVLGQPVAPENIRHRDLPAVLPAELQIPNGDGTENLRDQPHTLQLG
jgi:hypothetical protein